MPADPNVYALSVQLSLDSGQAFSQFEDFTQRATDLEDKLSTAAQQAITHLTAISTEAKTHLVDIGKILQTIDADTLKLNTNLTDIGKQVKEQSDLDKDHLKDLQKEYKLLEKFQKYHDDLDKVLHEHVESNDEFLKLTDDIIKAVQQKNQGHEAQNDLLRTDNNLMEQLFGTTRRLPGAINDATHASLRYSLSWRTLWALIKAADAETERFVTTNYRLYGSQQQLLEGARILASENAVFQENALAAYQALMDVKAPRDSLNKLAIDIGMATRVTGVAVQTLANYTRNLRSAGLTAEQISKSIATMAAAQRKLGLSTEDVSRLLRDQTLTGAEQATFFGKEFPEKFQIAQLGLEGIRKELGFTEKASQDLTNAFLRTGAEGEVFWQQLGTNLGANVEEKYAALQNGVLRYADSIDKSLLPAIKAGNHLTTQQNAELSVIAQNLGVSTEAVIMLIKSREALIGTDKEYLLTLQGVQKAVQADLELQKQYAEANQAFTGALKELIATFTPLIQRVVAFIANALVPLIKFLTNVIWVIAKVVDSIDWFITKLEQIPVIGKIITFLKWGAGILLALGVAFLFVAGSIASFAAMFAGVGGLISGASRIIVSIGNLILGMARVVGQAIVILLTSIGQGLRALGQAVSGVTVPLLALGAAFLMTGIGAYFFAQAVAIVADLGWAAIPAVLGLIAAIGLLGLVLIGLSTLIQGPIALGMIILAASIVAIGVGAILMGAGLYLAGMGLQMMAATLSFKLIAQLGLLAVAVVALGAAGLVAAPGLLALGVAFLVMSVAAVAAAGAMLLMSLAIQGLSAVQLVNFSVDLLKAAGILLIASLLLIVTGVTLAIGAALTAAGATVLLAASLVLIAASVLLVVAATFTLVGAVFLIAGAVLIGLAGTLILIGGTELLVGSVALVAGLAVLVPAAIGMVFSGVLLTMGAAALLPAAVMLMVAGVLLGIGGREMKAGVALVVQAVTELATIRPLITVIVGVAADLAIATISLLSAGIMLIPAAFAIYAGMSWLRYAVERFSKTITDVEKVGQAVSLLATSFMILQNTPTGGLKAMAAATLEALPQVEKLGKGLLVASHQLEAGVTAFARPAERLNAVLSQLTETMLAFGAGLTLDEDLTKLTNTLDKYTTLLEGASSRIEAAVAAKALPAIRAAEEAGIEETVRSEAITTVKVLTTSDGDVRDTDTQELTLVSEMVSVLSSIDERLATMQPGGRSELAEILSLLQAYLPGISKGDAGLGSELNMWGR